MAGSNDSTVFAWNSDGGELYGFDREDGSLRWRLAANEDAVGFFGEIRDDTAYLGDGPLVRAISTVDGTERWRYEMEGSVSQRPKFAGPTGYFGTVGAVHAVSTTDGTSRWQFATDSDTSAYVASVDDETVIVDSREDAIYALDAQTGRLQWRFGYDGRPRWFPQVVDDTVYFASEAGTVYALSPPGPTPLYDAYRTVTSPTGLAVGGLLGGALAVGAYRRYEQNDEADGDEADENEETTERTTFADFELRDVIAETDYATVYEARTPKGERVALTRPAEESVTPEAFSDAIETWTGLDGDGVLEVHEWGTHPAPWVATEFADATLADRADDLAPDELVHAVADAAETVHRAHREGVTQGYLSAESVLLVGDDVRIGDWRLPAELYDASGRSDIPRLAAMTRDLLDAEQVPDELDGVLARALSDDADDRYESALAFADALRWAVRE